jgi:hypothetical protein
MLICLYGININTENKLLEILIIYLRLFLGLLILKKPLSSINNINGCGYFGKLY